MDASQLTRLRQEAANVYLSRSKTVDSSFLTFKNQQRAAYAGAARFHTSAYYKGNPIVNPIAYDISSCPIDHSFTNGYTNVNGLSQNESLTNERAGAVICGEADYSTASPGIFLLSPSTCSTILTSYNNNRSQPSVLPLQINYPSSVNLTSIPSIYFDGNSFLELSTDTVYSGGSDFTMEFFINPSSSLSAPATQTIFYTGVSAIADTYKLIGNLITIVAGKKFAMSVQVSTLGTFRFGEFSPGKWVHIAIMRFGDVIYFYSNGTMGNYVTIPVSGIPSNSGTTNYLSGNESFTIIGAKYYAPTFTNGFIGNLTNFRWTKGKAVYTQTLDIPPVTSIINPFQVQKTPLFVYTSNDVYTQFNPYVAVCLLAQTASTLITNTRSPSATVSIQDGFSINSSYSSVTWAIV